MLTCHKSQRQVFLTKLLSRNLFLTTSLVFFLSQAGLEAASSVMKHHEDKEGEEKKMILQGPTIHDAARLGNLERMQQLLKYYPEMKE